MYPMYLDTRSKAPGEWRVGKPPDVGVHERVGPVPRRRGRDGQDEDKRRAREAGFNHHMTKPVEPAGLESLLARIAERN
jgi:hypothetical protein